MKKFTSFLMVLTISSFLLCQLASKEKSFNDKFKQEKQEAKEEKTNDRVGLSFEFKPAYFHPEDDVFRDIYTGGFIALFEMDYAFHPNFFFFNEIGIFHKSGKITVGRIKVPAKVTQVPISIGFGCNYLIGSIFDIYAKLAPNYVYTKTKQGPPFLNRKDHEHTIGATFGVGGKFTFWNHFLLDLFFNYRYDKESIHDLNSDTRFHTYVGGFEIGIGVGGTF